MIFCEINKYRVNVQWVLETFSEAGSSPSCSTSPPAPANAPLRAVDDDLCHPGREGHLELQDFWLLPGLVLFFGGNEPVSTRCIFSFFTLSVFQINKTTTQMPGHESPLKFWASWDWLAFTQFPSSLSVWVFLFIYLFFVRKNDWSTRVRVRDEALYLVGILLLQYSCLLILLFHFVMPD